MEYLLLILVLAVLSTVSGGLVMKGCANAYIHVKCPSDELVDIGDIKLTNAKPSSPCFRPDQLESQKSIPDQLSHLCQNYEQCIRVDECKGKTQCVFYISPDLFKTQSVNEGSEISVDYSCLPGTTRKAGIAVIAIVTIMLAIALAVTTFFICRNLKHGGDESLTKYDEFENRLSRTPSTASDLPSARYSKNGGPEGDSIEIASIEKAKEASAKQSSEIRAHSASVV